MRFKQTRTYHEILLPTQLSLQQFDFISIKNYIWFMIKKIR